MIQYINDIYDSLLKVLISFLEKVQIVGCLLFKFLLSK